MQQVNNSGRTIQSGRFPGKEWDSGSIEPFLHDMKGRHSKTRVAALCDNLEAGPLEQADIPVEDQADVEFQQGFAGFPGMVLHCTQKHLRNALPPPSGQHGEAADVETIGVALADDAANPGAANDNEEGGAMSEARTEIPYVFPIGARRRDQAALLGKAGMDEPYQVRHITDAGTADLESGMFAGWQDRLWGNFGVANRIQDQLPHVCRRRFTGWRLTAFPLCTMFGSNIRPGAKRSSSF